MPDGSRHPITYDAAGNLLRKNGLADVHLAPGNRLQSAGGETFTYDARQPIAEHRHANLEPMRHARPNAPPLQMPLR